MKEQTLGKEIRKCRKDKKMTQEALAEKADLSVSYMGAVERGEKLPSLEAFIRIADALEVSADRLLSGMLEAESPVVTNELHQKLSNLPPKERKRILNVMATMIEDSESP